MIQGVMWPLRAKAEADERDANAKTHRVNLYSHLAKFYYVAVAALVSVAAVVALQNLGSSLNSMFTTVSTELDTAVAAAGGP